MGIRNDNCTACGSGPVAVLGLGASGAAAARLLLGEGRRVYALDSADDGRLAQRARELSELGADVRLGADALLDGPIAYAVVSPGLAEKSSLRRCAAARGIEEISELELGWSRLGLPTIAVTGSNGKSSAVKWIAESLRDAGLTAEIGGNYGVPACELALRGVAADWLVLEVSSFQLETVRNFRAEIAVILNILPNHLDRHGDLQAYIAAKARIFQSLNPGDRCIINADLPTAELLGDQQVEWSSFAAGAAADWRYGDGWVSWNDTRSERWHRGDAVRPNESSPSSSIDLSGSYFANDVLGETAAAVMAVCDAAGIDPLHAVHAARSFEPLPHRMQFLAELDGVRFVDDSKSTNLAALSAAVRMSKPPLRLICGGRAKQTDFESVTALLQDRVARVYLIGAAAAEMRAAWQSAVDCQDCESLDRAVAAAWRDAAAGDTILLSPGCASFDQYASFEERGETYIKYVKLLAEEGRI
jgi:UDP-N-acetylmuramoylalanine--D-glutamate ligase